LNVALPNWQFIRNLIHRIYIVVGVKEGKISFL